MQSRSMASFFMALSRSTSSLVVKCFLGMHMLIRFGQKKIKAIIDNMRVRIYVFKYLIAAHHAHRLGSRPRKAASLTACLWVNHSGESEGLHG